MPPKQRYTREQILSAATEVVRAAGMPALTARALSNKLHCSVAPIFSVFDSMENLANEVIKQIKSIYAEYIKEGLTQPLPFKGAGLKFIEFAKNEPNFFRVLFMSENDKGLDDFMLLDENNGLIEGALESYWGLDEATARKLHKDVMIYTYGIAAMCATNSCLFTDEEISERLTFAFMAMLKKVKESKND